MKMKMMKMMKMMMMMMIGGNKKKMGENVKHSVFHFNLEAICSLSKYSELPKKDSHLKYNFGKMLLSRELKVR